jgi:hypothetical protein
VTCATKESTATNAKTNAKDGNDMLSKIGRMVIVACALPAHVRSKVIDLQVADERARVLADLLKVANGERDEARRERDRLADEQSRLERKVTIKDGVLSGLADELKIAQRERDGYRADVQRLTDEVSAAKEETSREYVEHISVARLLRQEIDRLNEELYDLRKPAESSVPTMLDEAGADGATCEWCLRDVVSVDSDMTLCKTCAWDPSFSRDDAIVRRRVRKRSCPTRRTSPDPHAVECSLGCGALAGEPCKVAP